MKDVFVLQRTKNPNRFLSVSHTNNYILIIYLGNYHLISRVIYEDQFNENINN